MTHPNTKSTQKPMPRGTHLPKGTSRRDILRWSLAGAGLAALGPFGRFIPAARGAPSGQKFVVVIYLYGGNDGTNLVIPTTLANYYSRREGLAIPVADQLSLDSGPGATTSYTLHPKMTNLQSMWTAGEVGLVNLVGYPQANLSHFTSQDVYSLGIRGEFADLGIDESGWIARYADLHAPTAMGAVSVGVGRPLDFVGGTSNPFLVSSLSSFQFVTDYRSQYRNNHPHRLDAIQELLDGYSGTGITGDAADALGQSHALTEQIQAAVADYTGTGEYFLVDNSDPDNPRQRTYNIHRYMQDIARLVQYGFETRVFYTGFGGFDTHSNQGQGVGRQADLFERLDTAIGAFKADMEDFGVWDDTVIIVTSEFGRRNFKNGSDGTDHGHGNCSLVAGGQVNGGMYGRDVTVADLDENWLGYDVDFRDIYREVINDHLGGDASAVFPETQEKNVTLGLV